MSKYMVTANEAHYIYPPRPSSVVPRESTHIFASLGYQSQFKFNDTRILIKYTRGWRKNPATGIELWNRHAEKLRSYTVPDTITEQLTHIGEKLALNPDDWTLLDGGLLDTKHRAIKDTLVIWDLLVLNNQHLLQTTYQERYNHLHNHLSTPTTWNYTHPTNPHNHPPIPFGTTITPNIFIPHNHPPETWDHLWEQVDTANKPYTIGQDISPVLEGLVLKNGSGKLTSGFRENNNSSWMVRSRVRTGRHRF